MDGKASGKPKGLRLIKTNYTWKHVMYDWKVIRIARSLEVENSKIEEVTWLYNEAYRQGIPTHQLVRACMNRWQIGLRMP